MKTITALAAVALISSATLAAPSKPVKSSTASKVTTASEPTMEIVLFEAAKNGVKEKLNDPESANFRALAIHLGSKPTDGTYYVCGEVNSKNSYGGYNGFTPFWVMSLYYKKQNVAIPAVASIYSSAIDTGALGDMLRSNCSN